MRKIVCLVLSVVLLLSVGMAVNADGNFVTANGFKLDTSTGYITDFVLSEYSGGNDIIIPNSIGGIKVVGIIGMPFCYAFDDLAGSDDYMSDEEIAQRKIYIPNNITFIDYDALYPGWFGPVVTVCCEKNSFAYTNLMEHYQAVVIVVDSVPQIDLQACSTSTSSGAVGSSIGQQITNVPVVNTPIIDVPTVDVPVETEPTDVVTVPEAKVPTVTTSFGATVSEWAAPEIEEAFENNLIPEVMLDFDLTKKVNRGEFAAIAVQLYEVLAKRSVEESPSCAFTDIQYDDNEKAIKKAYQIEVAQGTSTTTYEPLSFINREQLATMLCRVIKKYSYPNWTMENDADYYMDTTGVQKFADDVDISEWAKPSVYFMAKFGIVKGVSDTHFAPKNTTTQQEASGYASATREQAIILAQRIFKISDVFGN